MLTGTDKDRTSPSEGALAGHRGLGRGWALSWLLSGETGGFSQKIWSVLDLLGNQGTPVMRWLGPSSSAFGSSEPSLDEQLPTQLAYGEYAPQPHSFESSGPPCMLINNPSGAHTASWLFKDGLLSQASSRIHATFEPPTGSQSQGLPHCLFHTHGPTVPTLTNPGCLREPRRVL